MFSACGIFEVQFSFLSSLSLSPKLSPMFLFVLLYATWMAMPGILKTISMHRCTVLHQTTKFIQDLCTEAVDMTHGSFFSSFQHPCRVGEPSSA